jgi:hypothetical protein
MEVKPEFKLSQFAIAANRPVAHNKKPSHTAHAGENENVSG